MFHESLVACHTRCSSVTACVLLNARPCIHLLITQLLTVVEFCVIELTPLLLIICRDKRDEYRWLLTSASFFFCFKKYSAISSLYKRGLLKKYYLKLFHQLKYLFWTVQVHIFPLSWKRASRGKYRSTQTQWCRHVDGAGGSTHDPELTRWRFSVHLLALLHPSDSTLREARGPFWLKSSGPRLSRTRKGMSYCRFCQMQNQQVVKMSVKV